MATTSSFVLPEELPGPALLAFAAALVVYLLSLLGHFQPPVLITGVVLVCSAAIHLLYGVRRQQQGQPQEAATLLPFGVFWLSLISYDIFPQLGLGRHPDAITMFCYLSLWGMFSAILFLGSFQRSISVQVFYGAIMCSLLALSTHHLRDDQVFLFLGSGCGFLASLIALYIALAQMVNGHLGREALQLGHWQRDPEQNTD